MKIYLADNKEKDIKEGSTCLDIAKIISNKLASNALVARVNGNLVDLSYQPKEGDKIEILTFDSKEGKSVFWHSSSHVMAMAVQSLFPNTKIAIGPSIDNGFYYDFDFDKPLQEEDLVKIENKMKEIVEKKLPFIRRALKKEEAEKYFKSKNEIYKLELLNEIQDSPTIYEQDNWKDLCRGPHVPDTGYIRAFKLISIAGAYWRGSEKNKMLTRIYGISFPSQNQLDEYNKFIEEAKQRDHRKLGIDLDLYSINDAVGPGLVLWHPKGGRLRTIIEDFWRKEHYKNGYEIIFTPHIGRSNLWETSGHLDFYKENMYSPMEIDEREYYVKPMNCPFHIMIYKSRIRSYKELPLRWAELGTVYRYEKSGVLHGLLRVRGFTQDDAHIICSPQQMPDEIRKVIKFCLFMLKSFGFENFKIYLATRPKEKSVGKEEMWQNAQNALQSAIKEEGLECEVDEGGGAFYGPKIDIKIKDSLNREWQCSTIQFDFNLPERFDMTFSGPNNERIRPYMIHRALLGSIERFMGVLVEHYAGALPLWLSPVQVKIIPISDKYIEYAKKILHILLDAGFRAEIDDKAEKLGTKIRDAETQKIPYMAITGQKESDNNTVSVRRHKKGDIGSLDINSFIEMLNKEASNKINY
jgi:threonyl-tRNA synthetase